MCPTGGDCKDVLTCLACSPLRAGPLGPVGLAVSARVASCPWLASPRASPRALPLGLKPFPSGFLYILRPHPLSGLCKIPAIQPRSTQPLGTPQARPRRSPQRLHALQLEGGSLFRPLLWLRLPRLDILGPTEPPRFPPRAPATPVRPSGPSTDVDQFILDPAPYVRPTAYVRRRKFVSLVPRPLAVRPRSSAPVLATL